MTEEIINGVDVSGCIYKKDGIADCGMLACGGYKCEGQICLYKQLKRLEAENTKLKEKLNDIEYIISYCAINKKSCYFCKFDKECEGKIKDLILKLIRGAERWI